MCNTAENTSGRALVSVWEASPKRLLPGRMSIEMLSGTGTHLLLINRRHNHVLEEHIGISSLPAEAVIICYQCR